MIANILILCHGMTLNTEPATHDHEYNLLTSQLWKMHPELCKKFSQIIQIEYGHEMPRGSDHPLRPDEKITRAQQFVQQRVSYRNISTSPSDEDELLPPSLEFGSNLLRLVTNPIRDTVFAHGLTDALYYASSDGEREIRSVVFSQILDVLGQYSKNQKLRLHIIAHSLGSTIMFDFLYGLFRKDKPIIEQLESKTTTQPYAYWRGQTVTHHPEGRLSLAYSLP